MAIRVLLADDNARISKQLRSVLNRIPEMEVVGEAEDGEQARR